VAAALRESWPDHPEWVDMLTGILEEEPMGPDFGWFRRAKTQTRFDWESTRERLDRNRDGRRVWLVSGSVSDDLPDPSMGCAHFLVDPLEKSNDDRVHSQGIYQLHARLQSNPHIVA
jgi:hypothetical protein